MPVSATRAVWALALSAHSGVAFRQRNDVGTRDRDTFAAQWLAYALPVNASPMPSRASAHELRVDAVRSGRIEARTGLRMMPTFPRSPLSFRTAGFPPVRLQGWPIRWRLPARLQHKPAPGIPTEGFHSLLPPLRALRGPTHFPDQCRGAGLGSALPFKRPCRFTPRGPRSGPGYAAPVHQRLTGPIRPTRGHIATSPHGGLYAMPSLCGCA